MERATSPQVLEIRPCRQLSTLAVQLPAPAYILQGQDRADCRVLGTRVCGYKTCCTLGIGTSKGRASVPDKNMRSSQQTAPDTVFSIPLGSLSLLMCFLGCLPRCTLLIFAEISLPLSVLETKCPVWCPELKITDAGFLLPH